MINNPKITYQKEINNEYQKMRSRINGGKTLPYTEYVHARACVYINEMATKEQLKELRTLITRALIVYGELPADPEAR